LILFLNESLEVIVMCRRKRVEKNPDLAVILKS